jgi:hypothetical protein
MRQRVGVLASPSESRPAAVEYPAGQAIRVPARAKPIFPLDISHMEGTAKFMMRCVEEGDIFLCITFVRAPYRIRYTVYL